MGTESPTERLAKIRGHKRKDEPVVPNLDEFDRAREMADEFGLSALSLPDVIKHLHSNAMGGVLEVEEATKLASQGFPDVAPSLREAIERLQRTAKDAEDRAAAAEIRTSELRAQLAVQLEPAPVVPATATAPVPDGWIAPSPAEVIEPAAPTLDDLADLLDPPAAPVEPEGEGQ